MDSGLYFSLPLPPNTRSRTVGRVRSPQQQQQAPDTEEEVNSYGRNGARGRLKRKRKRGADQEDAVDLSNEIRRHHGDDDAGRRFRRGTLSSPPPGNIRAGQSPKAGSSSPSLSAASAASSDQSSGDEENRNEDTTRSPSRSRQKDRRTKTKTSTRHISSGKPANSNPSSQISIQNALATLSPPLLPPSIPLITPNNRNGNASQPISHRTKDLRGHHLSVLTTILHRCLLDGDYERAGRAWALLLRTNVRGGKLDVRGQGRWGIGAEVLLLRGNGRAVDGMERGGASEEGNTIEEDDENERGGAMLRDSFDEKGFGKAKEYYERLILQYSSHHRTRRHEKANALDFHLALFGLWIYTAQQQRPRQQRQQRQEQEGQQEQLQRHDGSFGSEADEDPSRDAHEDTEHALSDDEGGPDEARQWQLQEAESIGGRMDELMLSPPYSDSAEMWHLRGMVALWLADLYVSPAAAASAVGVDSSLPEPTTIPEEQQQEEEDAEHAAGAATSRRRTREGEERARAKIAFRKVLAAGGTVWQGVRYLLHDDDDEPEA